MSLSKKWEPYEVATKKALNAKEFKVTVPHKKKDK